MKKFLVLCAAAAKIATAQLVTGTTVNPTSGPPTEPVVKLLFYDGANNLNYLCSALQIQPQAVSFSVAAGTLTNIVVASSTATATTVAANKYYAKIRINVAGSATSALNGNYTVTSVTTNTLVFTTSGVSDGTYTDATIATQFPQTSTPVWSIQSMPYNSTLLQSLTYAQPLALMQPKSSTPSNLKCDDRASY
jgi:hypothetical protein